MVRWLESADELSDELENHEARPKIQSQRLGKWPPWNDQSPRATSETLFCQIYQFQAETDEEERRMGGEIQTFVGRERDTEDTQHDNNILRAAPVHERILWIFYWIYARGECYCSLCQNMEKLWFAGWGIMDNVSHFQTTETGRRPPAGTTRSLLI